MFTLEGYSYKNSRHPRPTVFNIYASEDLMILEDSDLNDTTSLTNYITQEMVFDILLDLRKEFYLRIKADPKIICIGSDKLSVSFDYLENIFRPL